MPVAVTPLHVVIPSYNQRSALVRCLVSVYASEYSQVHVLVVDDCSTDGTVETLRERFPACEVLVNARNLGFASACNAGVQVAMERGAELILLINQDTILAPDLMEILGRFMAEHPRAGIVGPKTYSFDTMPDGRPRLIYAGSWQGLLPLSQRIPGIERAETNQRNDPVEADYVWGHGMLLRTATLRETGGFDAAFPMYYEDLDLCRRARAAGYEVWCEPRAVMWHDQPDGARASRSEYWRWANKVRSTAVFHRKHCGRAAAVLLTPLTLLLDAGRLLRRGQGRAVGHLLLAAARQWCGLRDVRRSPRGRGV